MLIEFSVGNYRSFKETVTFSMVAAKLKSKDQRQDEQNVFNVQGELNLLKSAAIYGANASGKSNFISAMAFMRRFVLNSSRETQAEDVIEVESFKLAEEAEVKPSFFEIVFLLEGKRYRYGFEVNSERVISEWLFYTPTIKEAKLFTRDSGKIRFANIFKEGRGIVEKTRNNALFLSVVTQFNGTVSKKILDWFKSLGIFSSQFERVMLERTLINFESKTNKKDIVQLIKRLDLGIDSIELEKVRMTEGVINVLIRTIHKNFDAKRKSTSTVIFDLGKNESDGTKKLFSLSGPMLEAINQGKVFVIDELDAKLHPLITGAIIQLFNSNESNPNNAQLIFTTHDTNLLSNTIFRRDQIWFTEKNKQGATSLYSLAEFKVRNDASFEKDYIQGRYGAIPFIGDFSKLMGKSNG